VNLVRSEVVAKVGRNFDVQKMAENILVVNGEYAIL